MASDSFTNTNGTALSAHTAAGVTWLGVGTADAGAEIQDNVACADGDEFFGVSARASTSTADFSQVVFKAGAYLAESKAVCVRTSASTQGYWLQVYGLTGDTITTLMLFKSDGAFLTAAEGLTLSRLVDHAVAIKATTVSGNVQLQAWVDGDPLTFAKTDWDNETPSTTYTDLASETPILSGNPGFLCYSFDGIGPTNSGFDDWTDVEPSEETAPVIASLSDTTLTHGQTGMVITLTGGSASGNTVLISPTDNVADVLAVSQPISSHGTTSITLGALDLDSFAIGDTLYLFVVNDGDESNEVGEPLARVIATATLAFIGSDRFIDENGVPQDDITDITFYVWRSPRPTGAPDQTFTGQSTDENGEVSMSLALGSLEDGDTVFFLGFTPDGTNLFCAGERLPVYA